MASQNYSLSATREFSNGSRLSAVLRRAPLLMVTVIFTLVAFRYLSDPVRTAATAGISFTTPGGMIVAQVGFAAFPLALAILALTCLISPPRRLAGLYMVLTVVSVVIAVRIFGMLVAHSSETARLLAPEAALLTLSIIAIRLESAKLRRQVNAGTPSFKHVSE